MAEEQIPDDFSVQTTDLGITEQPAAPSPFSNYKIPIALVAIGFYFFLFAILELVTNYSQTSFSFSLSCTSNACTADTQSLSFPDQSSVYVYLKSSDLNQNDIRFTDADSTLTGCSILNTNDQMSKTVSVTGTSLTASASAYPCGELATSYPEGTLTMTNTDSSTAITISSQDLTVFTFDYQNEDTSLQWADVETERFAVWEEKNLAIGVVKYWGVITDTISGSYTFSFQTTNPMTDSFKSDLSLVLTDNKALSGLNLPSCIFYFVAAILQFALGCFSFWARAPIPPKETETSAEPYQTTQEVIIKVPRISF